MSPQYDTRVCNLDTAHVKSGERVYVVEDNPRLGLVILQVDEPLRADQSRRRFYVTRSEWDAMQPVEPHPRGASATGGTPSTGRDVSRLAPMPDALGHVTGATPRADA